MHRASQEREHRQRIQRHRFNLRRSAPARISCAPTRKYAPTRRVHAGPIIKSATASAENSSVDRAGSRRARAAAAVAAALVYGVDIAAKHRQQPHFDESFMLHLIVSGFLPFFAMLSAA